MLQPDPAAVDRLKTVIYQRFGIFFDTGETAKLTQCLDNACAEAKVPSYELFYTKLLSSSTDVTYDLLARHVTINHTGWFREDDAFDLVRQTCLPALKRQANIRVWSAASASGEELYTLVMVLADALGIADLERRWRFLGTDLDLSVVSYAEQGIYSRLRMANVPEDYRTRFFKELPDGRFQVIQRLRDICTFRRLNLASPRYPFEQQFHLVFCRNVLYYFDKPQRSRVLKSIYQVTAADGWLVTGVSEAVSGLNTRWNPVKGCLYARPASALGALASGGSR